MITNFNSVDFTKTKKTEAKYISFKSMTEVEKEHRKTIDLLINGTRSNY